MAQARVPVLRTPQQAALPRAGHAALPINYSSRSRVQCRTVRGASVKCYQANSNDKTTPSRALPEFGREDKPGVQPMYRRVHELLHEADAPAMWLKGVLPDSIGFLFVRHPALVQEVLADAKRFPKNRPGDKSPLPEFFGSSIGGALDGPQHRHQRETLQPHFQAEFLRTLAPRLVKTGETVAETLLTLCDGGAAVDLEDLYRRAVLDNFGRTDLGFEFHAVEDLAKPHDQRHLYDGKEFMELWDDMSDGAQQLIWAGKREGHPADAVFSRAIGAIRGIIRSHMEAARVELAAGSTTRSDLVTMLLRAQQEGSDPGLTDQLIEDELLIVLVGAFDTAASAMAWTTYHLAHHPDWQRAVHAEIDGVVAGRAPSELRGEEYRGMETLLACVNEAMRLNPPVAGSSRAVAEDTVLGGRGGVPPVDVAAGTIIGVSLYSMHHDEGTYARAEEWLPERWLPDGPQELKAKRKDAMAPFGAGARICIGRQYALLAMPIVLTQVLARARVAPAVGKPEAKMGSAMVVKSVDGIWATAEGRP